jgi:transcriptional regulator with XRE-family HTH domain
MDIPVLPYCRIVLKAQRPFPPTYPKSLKTLGDHLRKKRLDLKLLQKEVAERIGTSETSVFHWENNQTEPSLPFIPKIIEFLGYVPNLISPNSLGEKIVVYRKLLGLTQKELAKQLGIDPSTLGRWERGESKPLGKFLNKIKEKINT